MNKTTIIASAVALALGLSACSEQKSLEQLLASANEFSAQRDFGSAVIELKNAVRIAPKSAQARLALGKAYLEQGNYIFAEKELEKSQQLGVEQANVLPFLAQVKAKLRKSEAVYQLVEVSSDLNDDDYIIVLTYAGIAALADGDTNKGQDYIGQAIAISENSTYSQIGKAYLARSEQDYSQSLVDIEDILQSNPNLSEALLLKAHLLFALTDYEQAAGSFASYLTQHPMDYSVRYFEINSLIKAELFEQAEVITDKLLEKFENAPLALQYKAQLQHQKKNFKESQSYAERAIQAGATTAKSKLIAGASAFHLQEYEQAYHQLKSIEAYLTPEHPATKMLAIVNLKLGYISAATESFSVLDGESAEELTLLKAASFELSHIQQYEAAEKLLIQAEKSNPKDAMLIAQKGLLQLQQNDVAGVNSLESALALDGSLMDVELTLAMQYLRTGEDDKSQDIATKAINSNEYKAAGYLLQGIIATKQDKVEQAKSNFNQVLTLEPNNVSALFNLAVFEENENDIASASEYYQQTLTANPNHTESLNRFTAMLLTENKIEKAVSFLTELLALNQESLNTRLTLANLLRKTGDGQQAIAVIEQHPEKELKTGLYWVMLGDNYLSSGNNLRASEAYNRGLNKHPNYYLLHLRSIGLLGQDKDYVNALSATENAYSLFVGDVRLQMLLAHYLLLNGNEIDAKLHVEQLQAKGVDHPLLTSVLADLAMTRKDYTAAREFYNEMYEQQPEDKTAIDLARALKFDGQSEQAEKLLETHLHITSNKHAIRLVLASLYSLDKPEKALQQYQLLVDEIPDNAVLLNNLAWAQYKAGKHSVALTNIERAFQLDSEQLAIIESYGVILAANKEYGQAVDILELAIAKGSSDIQVEESLINAKIEINQ